MGKCVFCHRPAGFLNSVHKGCLEAHQKAVSALRELFNSQLDGVKDGVGPELERICQAGALSPGQRDKVILSCWNGEIAKDLEHGLIGEERSAQLLELVGRFGFDRDALNDTEGYRSLAKAAVLRALMAGKVPQNVIVDSLPFNFQKDEALIWVFPGTVYSEDQVQREYIGGSRGMSFRVVKGVYYRTGSYRGRAIEHTKRVVVDTGLMAVTNRSIYFGGPRKTFRIALNKIVAFEPFSDGVGVTRDAANAKLQVFRTGDGWFTHNLLENVARL